jgi:hypothetical protein
MDWAAWGPTIVSIITCIFFAGVLYSNQLSHEKRLNEHDVQLEDHTKEFKSHAVEIGMIKAFQNGYATAKALYEHRGQVQE